MLVLKTAKLKHVLGAACSKLCDVIEVSFPNFAQLQKPLYMFIQLLNNAPKLNLMRTELAERPFNTAYIYFYHKYKAKKIFLHEFLSMWQKYIASIYYNT